jgi:DNA-binding response OmpR family regulator
MEDRVLIIDDDPDIHDLVNAILKPQGIKTFDAFNGMEGLKKAYETHPDLIILDVSMPVMDGFEVCSRLRELSNVPILMLTARAQDADTLRGFNSGADDYVKKPFKRTEFEARVRALLRRKHNNLPDKAVPSSQYEDEILRIDVKKQAVFINNENIMLTPTEFALLTCLVRFQGRVVSHRELLREVWGEMYSSSNTAVALYVYYLRKKIEDGKHGGHQYIHTQWGRGYWFAPRNSQ